MKLGLENLSPAPEPVVEIDLEALKAELDSLDAVVGEFAVSQETMTDCEKLAGVVAEFGFGDELKALYGAEIEAAGIDLELSKEDLAAAIVFAADMDLSEEGFKEFLSSMPALKNLPGNLWIDLQNLWGNFTAKIGQFASRNGAGGKAAIKAKVAGRAIWSKSVPFLKGVNPLVWVALASVMTIAVLLKILHSSNIKKLMTNSLNLVPDNEIDELLKLEGGKLFTAASFKAKISGTNKVAKTLLSTTVDKLDASTVEAMGKTVNVELAKEKGSWASVGYSKSGLIAQHKAAREAFATMSGLMKAVGSAKPSDSDAEIDKALVKATKAVAVDTVKSLNYCVKQHIGLVRPFLERAAKAAPEDK